MIGFHLFQDSSRYRCFHCKIIIYSKLWDYALDNGFDMVVDGCDASYSDKFKLKTIEKLGVFSPLLQGEFTKSEISKLASHYHISSDKQQLLTCFAERIPYGTQKSKEKLNRIKKAEEILKKLHIKGNIRLQDHGEVARIEIEQKFVKNFLEIDLTDIIAKLKALGYKYITLDLEGYQRKM